MKFRVILTVFPILLFSNCKSVATKMRFPKDPDLMEQEILHYLLIGSSIENTQMVMEQNRFKCQKMRNSSFFIEGMGLKENNKLKQILDKDKDLL